MNSASHCRLSDEMRNLRQGDHLCLFYERDPAEQMPALIPFIADALSQDEQFIYIADDQTVEQLSGHLERNGIEVAAEVDRGALKLWTRREWRQAGELDSARKSAQVLDLLEASARAGFKGARFAVEMTWTLGPDISAAQLKHWEATINTIFVPGSARRIICQYNRSRLSPEVLLAALHTHPLAILGEEIHPNLFYEAPLIPAAAKKPGGNGSVAATQVDWMVSQLRHARTAELERRATTELKQLADMSRHMAAIVESSDDAIISKDLNGVILSWNRAAERLFGYTADEIVGRPVTVLIPAVRHDEEPAILERLRRGQRIEHYETVRQRKDGSLIDISLTVSPIKDGTGRIVGASKIARDISERRAAERALREAKEALARTNAELEQRVAERTASLRETIHELEAFSCSISHDLRAPLRSMQGFSQMLLESHAAALDAQGRNYLQRIANSARRLDVLIQDVLNYTRVLRGPVPLVRVDLDRLVRELIYSYPNWQPPLACVEVNGMLPTVMGHEGFLTQCLSNLIGNAVKFVAPGVQPAVGIRAQPAAGSVRICIQDNGIGIAPENHARIFRMFERIHSPREYEGTGIGLTIVRKAVERMGGQAGFESAPGQGSTFWIELQACEAMASP